MGIGDWGLGNPQSPIPNPQNLNSNIKIKIKKYINILIIYIIYKNI